MRSMISMENIQPLTDLLNRAIQATAIRDQRRNQQMDISLYKDQLRSCWDTYKTDIDRIFLDGFTPRIDDADLEEEVLGLISSALADHIHEGRVQTATIEILGGSHPGVQMKDLLQQLLKVALVRSPNLAAQSFHQAVEGKPIAYQRIALLNGIRVENEIEVCKGIRLISLPNSTSELPNIFPHINYMSPIDLLGKTLIGIDYTVSPAFLNPKVTTTTIDDAFDHTSVSDEHPEFKVEEFCDALSMACDGSIEYIAMWKHLSHDHVVNVLGKAGSHHFKPFSLHETNRALATEDLAKEALSIYESRRLLRREVADRLKVPIDRWIKSKGDQPLPDSMIDLGIALEALFLSDLDGSAELSYRLRLRAAWYLGKDADERSSILDDVGQVYGKRSAAVHGKDVPADAGTEEVLTRGQTLCLQAIHKILKCGRFPNWNRLVLGD